MNFKAIICQYIDEIKLHQECTQIQDFQEILSAMEDAAASYEIMMQSHGKLQDVYTHLLSQ